MTQSVKSGLEALRFRRLELQETGSDRVRLGESLEGSHPSFADTLRDALGEVSELHVRAEDTIGAFLRGEPVETHRVMAAAEEAGIALEMLIEIRNKVTEAYRAVMQMHPELSEQDAVTAVRRVIRPH